MTKHRLELPEGFREIQHTVPAGIEVAGESRQNAVYISVTAKFVISTLLAVSWVSFSLFVAQPWLADLAAVVGSIPAFLIILFIALIPGFLNAHIVLSVLLDSPPRLRTDIHFPPISILIAAYNEAENLSETFRSIEEQD
ncbi:MAG TPA: hypothetical protein VLA34_14510, partial [Candidatus Krumholzibacterium sp.]|nr:hypothetical protein [Candidatus Krumholzibacterium sp.]